MGLFDGDNLQLPFGPQLPFELPQEPGYATVRDEAVRGFLVTLPQGEILYADNFFSPQTARRSVEYFQENRQCDWRSPDFPAQVRSDLAALQFENINWQQDSMRIYGKVLPLPRLTAWYGDRGRSYTYSGIRSEPNPWNKGLLYLKRQVEGVAGARFNSVLLNWYRDGEDCVGWHADDEQRLGRNPVIASVSFGETRDFVVRRKDDKSRKIVFPLGQGSLLIMRGELQHYWEHAVPRRLGVRGSRFNLTFRSIQ